jgi:signal transduction histidine kinase
MPQAAAVFSLLVSCFCALLWWQQRDALYAWAALGEALWAVTVADTVVETAPLPWPYWGLALLLLRALWAWSLYAIAEQVFGRRPAWERRSVMAVQAGVPLCMLAMVLLNSTQPLKVWYAINFATFVAVIVRLGWQSVRVPRAEHVLMVLTIAACLAASVRDAVAARWDATLYDESAWAKYVATLVGAAVMWIVSQRFSQARSEVLRLNTSLVERIELKERELRRSFESLSRSESERAVTAERARILRDMHDGVGASLASAMRQLESGQAAPREVAQTLRESLDHLKLSIDAMSLPPGDVNALLASLRYRLQPRIEGAGLVLRWHVDALPAWDGGTDAAMRHLQFVLLEAFSNALQHARATTLTLGARAERGRIEITLGDDGRGIESVPGSGLAGMRERARAIGAELAIRHGAPGTCVHLALPQVAPAAHGVSSA